jgi:hypothetical protein
MNRAIQFAGVVWLGAVIAVCSDQKPPKPPPPPKPPAAAKIPKPAPNNAGGAAKGTAKMANPDNPIDRLFKMSPEERERAIEKLPPQQQANIRKQLENFDKRPEAAKEWELQRLNTLWSLPPATHALVSQQIKAFNSLPPDRLEIVKPAYVRLSRSTPEQREEILARPQFRSRFSPAELQILTVLPEYWPAQPAKAGN